MKVCENCGAQLEDNAQFCVSCGTKVDSSASQEAKKAEAPKKASPFAAKQPGNKAIIGIIAVGVVALFLIIMLIVNLITGYKKPIKSYFKAANKSTKYETAGMLPAVVKKGKCKITYKIDEVAKVNKGKLDDLAEIFEDEYDAEYKFSAAKVVEVDVKIDYKEGKDIENTVFFIVVKKGAKWYIYDEVTKGSTYKDVEDVIKTYIEINGKSK